MSDREGHRRRGLLWTIAVLAALVVLYAFAGFVVVPRVARQQLIQYAARDLQAQVRIGSVRFNPFTLRADLSDFALSTKDGAPLMSFAHLEVVAALSSLWQGLTLRQVQLDRPALEAAVAADGTLNWARLTPATPAPAAGAPSGSHRSSALGIEALSIHAGRIHFEDRSHGQPFSTVLDPIELELHDFHSTPDFQNRVHLSARTTAGESLDFSGEFSLQPFASTGTLQLSALKAATIAAYLQNGLPFSLLDGSLDAHASYRWSSGSQGSAVLTLETLLLRDVAIAPRAATATPWIVLPQLQLSDAQVDLASRRVQVRELRLQRPSLQVWREPSGALNLLQLTSTPDAAPDQTATAHSGNSRAADQSPAAPAPSSAATPSTSTHWTLDLQALKVEDGKLALEDRSVEPAAKLRLSSIGLQLQGFSSAAPARPLALELSMNVGDGGQLRLQGELTRAIPSAHLKLDLQRLDLAPLQPYLARQTDLALYRGNLSAQAQVSYGAPTPASDGAASKPVPQLDVSGSLTLSDLAARERTGNSELANWQSLELSGVHYQQQPDALRIEHITLRRAYGRVLIGSDGTLNIEQVLHPPRSGGGPTTAVAAARAAPASTSEPTAQAASSGAGPMPIRIDRIDINGSTANFTDQSVQPNFSAAILGLRGSIVGLSSAPEARAQVHLSGQIERYAPVAIDGELNPLATTAYTDLSLKFSNIDLTIFNPYSGKFAGYSIAQGKLATQMHYHVEDRKLQATHHIEIDQLEFGPATENKPAVPLPIKLAAALLKDRHGVISIDLPVSGTVDDPSFRLGPLIGRALLGLLTKAVTAPFSWLGSVFGGGEQLAYVDFAAGSSQLRPDDQPKVAQLAKALGERPQLKLDIPLHTISAADDRALAQAALAQAAAAEQSQLSAVPSRPARRPRGAKPSAPEIAKSPQVLALEALYRAQFQADPVYPSQIGAASGSSPGTGAGADGAASAPPAGSSAATDGDPRASWLEQQLLEKFLPNGAQRDALGRARADAMQAAIIAAGQLSPERIFLTNRLSGGGSEGMSRMELQLQ